MKSLSALLQRRGVVVCLLLFILVSCKVTLLSAYDEATDRIVSEMQQTTTAFFVQHESTPESVELAYNNQSSLYLGLKTRARTLRIRNNAVEKNKPMITMLDLLDQNITLMDSLHRSKPNGQLSITDVRLLKASFETQYTAMFKFILALKARAQAQ